MPKVSTVQTNFTAGEWSPNMLGRTDLTQYLNAAEALENVVVLPQGGARRRPGLRYVAAAKFAAKRARLIPFVFSETDAYVLEVGDLYIRFYKNGAQIGAPYEIVTSYTEAMLDFIDYVQGADTMIATHQAVAPQRLRRFADTNWVLDAVPFEISPFDEIGHSFSASLTLSAATVGVGRTVTASSGIFLNGDVGRQIVFQGGVLKITAFTAANQVTGDITSAFGSVNVPADVWTLDGSPQDAITPNVKDPLEATVTLTSAGLNLWRTADVGKFVRVNGGIVQITGTTALVATGVIKQVLAGVTAAPKNSWSLEATVWSAGNGYPQAVTLNGQRLIFGGSLAYPQTLWGSSVGAYFDNLLGTNDADAFAYTLSSDQINPILHFASGKTLFAFTYGGEFTIRGGVEKPITPTNVQVKNETAYGSGTIRPVRAGKQELFVDQSYLQLLSFNYDASEDDFDAEDLTLLADHISGTGFVDLSYQRTPVPLVYAPREDGQCPTLTLHEKQQVAAWSRQITNGFIESVCTIPVAGGHQTWVLVRRTINGATVRNVEVFDDTVACDSALTGSSAGGLATWSAAHLPNTLIQCVADGRYMGTFTTNGAGQFTLPRTAKSVMYGLPFSCRIKILTPEIQTGEGTAQGNAMSTHEIAINFLQSYACKVNGIEVPFRKLGSSLLDQALTPFTGYKKIENLGWNLGVSDIEITSDVPLPFHVRAIVRKWSVNAG